ncbi:unnamed protein product [Protopolystoma xenopodis]|uniref:Uncharacterized protein n=1 Tax=Protopolystoma xenopodis TaxID=117903 RepID=A0A3S5FBW9_9PLAT|nr:unnamed protein product [Protopolystoma xenopodis]
MSAREAENLRNRRPNDTSVHLDPLALFACQFVCLPRVLPHSLFPSFLPTLTSPKFVRYVLLSTAFVSLSLSHTPSHSFCVYLWRIVYSCLTSPSGLVCTQQFIFSPHYYWPISCLNDCSALAWLEATFSPFVSEFIVPFGVSLSCRCTQTAASLCSFSLPPAVGSRFFMGQSLPPPHYGRDHNSLAERVYAVFGRNISCVLCKTANPLAPSIKEPSPSCSGINRSSHYCAAFACLLVRLFGHFSVSSLIA